MLAWLVHFFSHLCYTGLAACLWRGGASFICDVNVLISRVFRPLRVFIWLSLTSFFLLHGFCFLLSGRGYFGGLVLQELSLLVYRPSTNL